MSGRVKGGRDLVAQFAGHLAHLVNGDDHLAPDAAEVEIRPFHLFERVHRGLTVNRRYLDGLVGLWSYPEQEPTAAADCYFDMVLDRPIARRPGRPSSADTLGAFLATAACGPLPVPGEGDRSTWRALVEGPSRIRRFRERVALFQLSNLILRCLDAANRPYAEVLRLGLCPKDWLTGSEEVSVNTLKAANGFLKALRAAMGGEVGRRPTAEELEAAFRSAPVPGSSDGAAFARTVLGAAILVRVAGHDIVRTVPLDETVAVFAATLDAHEDDDLLSPGEAAPLLSRAAQAGAIGEDERRLVAAVISGNGLAEALRSELGLRRRLSETFDGDLGAFLDDLATRLAGFVRAQEGRP